jgi:hypothetical protein
MAKLFAELDNPVFGDETANKALERFTGALPNYRCDET